MLIGFKLRNFRSFLDEQSFRYSTTNDRTHESTHCVRTGNRAEPRLSKTAVIFGPNASGKTNLFIAIATLRDLVMHSTAYSDVELAERHTPFQFGPSANLPTAFEIEILLGRIRYCYSMSYDRHRIRSERLLVYQAGKAQHWFERRFNETSRTDDWGHFSPSFKGLREMWRKATQPTALFLTTAARLDSAQLQPLIHWFEHCLEVVLPADMADLSRVVSQMRDVGFKLRVLRMLWAVDIKVDDLRIAEQKLRPVEHAASRTTRYDPRRDLDRNPCIEFLHAHAAAAPIWLDSTFEAASTYRILNLCAFLLQAFEHEKCIVIDDLDAGVHPLVARFLMQLVNDPKVSGRRTQLLTNSHNAALMDVGLLRRDEIWLVELNERRTSNLSRVLRSRPRKGELLAKSYLRGRYGAIPAIHPELRSDFGLKD